MLPVLAFVEFVVILAVIVVAVTQVVVPLWRGVPTFQSFRRRPLTKRVLEAREDLEADKLVEEELTLRDEVATRRRSRMRPTPPPPGESNHDA